MLTSLVIGSECSGGIQVSTGGVLTRAEHDVPGSTRALALRGSYLTDASGSHQFSCDIRGSLEIGSPFKKFLFESTTYFSESSWTTTKSCTKDFRYQIGLDTVSDYSSPGLTLRVTTPIKAQFTLTGAAYIQTCEENGCRERDYVRDPFLCMVPSSPPKTLSIRCTESPSLTQPPSPEPTATAAPAVTLEPSPSPTSFFTQWKNRTRGRKSLFFATGWFLFCWTLF
jgi:hypothetical protein